MKVVYGDRQDLQIVPKWDERSRPYFQVVKISTGEIMIATNMLYKAEQYLEIGVNTLGKDIIVGSAVEIEGY